MMRGCLVALGVCLCAYVCIFRNESAWKRGSMHACMRYIMLVDDAGPRNLAVLLRSLRAMTERFHSFARSVLVLFSPRCVA